MEIVLVIIALAFGTGVLLGALLTYFAIQCCRPSKAISVPVNEDFGHFSEQNYESGSANMDQDFYRYLANDYKENWITIVSDDRRVYHAKTDCRTTKRTNPSLFRRYRLCKICGYALHCDTTAKSHADKKSD